ncbi:Inversin [Varanus komodoensis]|nr:Inversin [Varanus komodoensis]
MQLAIQQLTTAHHHIDCDSCALVGSVTLQRHAWLRSCNFLEETKRRIKGMPFNGSGLFQDRTDHKLKHIYNARATARKMEIPGLNHHKWHQSQFPRRFLRFTVGSDIFEYNVLPFRLATAPRVFTKCMAPICAHLRQRGHRVHWSATQFGPSTGISTTDAYGQTLFCGPSGPERRPSLGPAYPKTVGPYGINNYTTDWMFGPDRIAPLDGPFFHPSFTDNTDPRPGRTALHWLCNNGYLDAIKLLLGFGAFPNHMENHEEREKGEMTTGTYEYSLALALILSACFLLLFILYTPLDYALLGAHHEVIQFMLEHSALSIAAIQDIAAIKIQAVYKGYKVRKTFQDRKNLLMKHEQLRKDAAANEEAFPDVQPESGLPQLEWIIPCPTFWHQQEEILTLFFVTDFEDLALVFIEFHSVGFSPVFKLIKISLDLHSVF